MGQKESEVDKFLRNLTESRFEEILDDKEDLDKFYTFLRNRAIPSGGYVISLPLSEGGLSWLLYKITNVRRMRTKLQLAQDGPLVFVPEDFSDRTLPEDCQNYPIWWLEEQYKKQNG